MNRKKIAELWMPLLIVLMISGSVLATNTPIWWDNPKNIPYWTQTIATGTASNTGPQSQFIIAKIDVGNTYREDYSKYVWVQIEWSLVQGSGEFMTGSTDHLIKWMNGAGDCPADPSLPFPDPPDGVGFMKPEGAFTPEFGYQHGFELSYFKITPQPACERLEIRFQVDPNSNIQYHVEIQTACIKWDFGDAPDPSYPTLNSHNGARHIITNNCYLGSGVDGENDGQPNADATGDDLNGDDEDGVQFVDPSHMTQGSTVAIEVTASRAGYLSAWADFDHNSSWADAGEAIFDDRPLTAGINNLSFTIPADAAVGATFLRFRFSTDQNLSFTGAAGDGEVEDYMISVLAAQYDFGDAPDPTFPTLLANNGARHKIGNLLLGTMVDADVDGHPAVDATGDDSDGVDDEDGVVFNASSLKQGSLGSVTVTANSPGLLNAWIDFNNNGSWNDSGEQIFTNKTLAAGANALTFAIPVDAEVAEVFARFRFNSTGNLAPTGPAEDGEVEDYQIQILVPVELTSFTAQQSYGTVTLEWVTQSESENLGYYIYRADEKGSFERISNTMIPGAGTSATMHTYGYSDVNVLAGQTYQYKLADVDYNGRLNFSEAIEVTVNAPDNFSLEQNYPNPFNPTTVIPFKIKQAGAVRLEIYNLKGQTIATLINRQMEAGSHTVVWDGKDGKGNTVPSGSYICKMKVNEFEQIRMMEFIK